MTTSKHTGGGSEPVDLVTGGFPCQPFSDAGKKKGTQDDRDLWPHMFRIIKETRPRWVLGENVAGFITMALDRTITDLESTDYTVQVFVIPACAVGAPHRRDRVWIVAHSDESGKPDGTEHAEKKGKLAAYSIGIARQTGTDASNGKQRKQSTFTHSAAGTATSSADTLHERREGIIGASVSGKPALARKSAGGYPQWSRGWPVSKPLVLGAHDGIPDRIHRTRALGNAIVPQVAAEIMRAIKAADTTL